MEINSPSASTAKTTNQPRLLCFVNGIFASGIGGGDVYFSYMANAALAAGYPIHFFGGHALKNYLAKQNLPLNLTLTDDSLGQLGDVTTLPGQLRLLWDFGRRLRGSLAQLNKVQSDDIAYA